MVGRVLRNSKHGLPAKVPELVDVPMPDALQAVGLAAATNEITSIYRAG
jgi:hypothetical protein